MIKFLTFQIFLWPILWLPLEELLSSYKRGARTVMKKITFLKNFTDLCFRSSSLLISWHLHIAWKLPRSLARGLNWYPNKYIVEIDGINATLTLKGNTNIIFLNSATSRATRVTDKFSATLGLKSVSFARRLSRTLRKDDWFSAFGRCALSVPCHDHFAVLPPNRERVPHREFSGSFNVANSSKKSRKKQANTYKPRESTCKILFHVCVFAKGLFNEVS